MIWSKAEIRVACNACPTTFKMSDVQDATKVIFGARVQYSILKNHVYNLIEDGDLFRVKRGVFALAENDGKVINPETLEQLQEMKTNLEESTTRVEDAELQLSIAQANRAAAEAIFIEAYQKIASERMADINEALDIEVLVLPTT